VLGCDKRRGLHAFFTGLIGEVRIYTRAVTPQR
jgi:hypothetical protein